MFLVRGFFWLSVVVLLVPASQFESIQRTVYAVAPVVLSHVGEQVANTILDYSGACEEQPEVCAGARSLFAAESDAGLAKRDDLVRPAGLDEDI